MAEAHNPELRPTWLASMPWCNLNQMWSSVDQADDRDRHVEEIDREEILPLESPFDQS
jgi:hypothetical protein